ncbi:hypothetical protein LTR05_004410 [Lithohypha guttulata]|uniref:AMP-binding enzyme C-terminal domain-containing protein n=1 Tax=Lithohypha guttulata TaxID=1690604 RepID=A0AAN7YIE7_9EURO|nr:hypothetical protein LTR05_004410 [Lithohypha guttulata]
MSGESGASFLDDEQGRWFVTGDTAMIDNDGVVFILGRTKDMISKGGSIVVPAAIESFLQRRLKLQVVVVSIPCKNGGYESWVIVEDQADGEISSWLVEEFGASYAVRHVFTITKLGLDGMPRSGTGKMDKLALQDAVMRRLEKSVS